MCNSTHCSHGLCLYAVYMKNTSYKTNQTDSLQMETKVQSQLRSDLIHCLSSDSMWSHPEIPHKPHLFSIWPCSHAIQYCTAARPVLHRQQDSALKHFNEENKSGWGGEKDIRDKINAMVYEERDWEMTALTPLSVIDLCWFCLACALFRHEHVHCWSLPDDSLHDEISLPADHMTYRMLRGVLTRTEYPPCIPHVIILMSWLWFPLLPSHPRNRNILFQECTWGLCCLSLLANKHN